MPFGFVQPLMSRSNRTFMELKYDAKKQAEFQQKF